VDLGWLEINADIRRARTLPTRAYTDGNVHELAREIVFARSWQLVGDPDRLERPGTVLPATLLPGMLDEPVLLTRDADDTLRCLSNVCTHRGNIIVDARSESRTLRCRYHGRRFDLAGRMLSMPEFEEAEGFPTKEDDLPELPLERFGKLLFTSLDPQVTFEQLAAPVRERLAFLDQGDCRFDRERSRDYDVAANWALYCDNYLEGFHIPYVHPGLAGAIDVGGYRTELFDWCSLQVALARPGETAFELPPSSPDHGERIAAYYFWLFPNTMINAYPWGLSVNVVLPLAVDRTRISFLAFVAREDLLGRGAGGDLDLVEREDEAVVAACQRGVCSRLYDRGRYSPTREKGVHHFHRLLAAALTDARGT